VNIAKLVIQTSKPKAWEIWLANVDFEGMAGRKKRPVLVLSAKGTSFTVLEITSQAQRLVTDIEIHNFQDAGLDRLSVIRTDKKKIIGKEEFVHEMGKLPPDYRETVSNALKFRKSMESDDI
jgi:mRNA-degrading endonuclease toxin of MazEF toxin-antitoxin module